MKTKQYHIWTDNGNWDFIADDEYLQSLLAGYNNFRYEVIEA